MNLRLIAFSRRGAALGARLCAQLTAQGHLCDGVVCTVRAGDFALPVVAPPPADWVRLSFAEADGLIFVGAAGIAVREAAPFLRGKAVDPAVVVLDERGRWAVSLLSGHIGGANRLANEVAAAVGAQAVITTATDASGLFAVDEFAARRGLALEPLTAAKAVSAALLDGQAVGFCSDFPVAGALPDGLTPCEGGPLGIAVTARRDCAPFDVTLRLIPPVLTLGIGCRRGALESEITAAVDAALAQANRTPAALAGVASVDLKADEAGLLAFCQARALPLVCYDAARLTAVAGDFSHSDRVERVTGVGCVCERAACCEGGRLILPKTSLGPVSVALAERSFPFCFDEGELP